MFFRRLRWFVRFGPVSQLHRRVRMADFVLLDDQQVTLTLQGEDDAGNQASLPPGTSATWAVGDDTLLTITPSPDTLSANVVAQGKLGNTQVTVTVGTLQGVLGVTIQASALATIAVVPGTPSHK